MLLIRFNAKNVLSIFTVASAHWHTYINVCVGVEHGKVFALACMSSTLVCCSFDRLASKNIKGSFFIPVLESNSCR